jgi:Raf kinase inhibitor-like YbhB/YbcL family protein
MATLSNLATLSVSSPAFEPNGIIPDKYTCQGRNINPAISVGNLPHGTISLTLIIDDPDAANGTFTHWIVWNIRPEQPINEDSVPGIQGENSFGTQSYKGPCPPSGTHRYIFKLFALDTLLDLKAGADKETVEKAMKPHMLGTGTLTGKYKKLKSSPVND